MFPISLPMAHTDVAVLAHLPAECRPSAVAARLIAEAYQRGELPHKHGATWWSQIWHSWGRAQDKFFAESHGYYWIPCPICGEGMGGHDEGGETLSGDEDFGYVFRREGPIGMGGGKTTCKSCEVIADRIYRVQHTLANQGRFFVCFGGGTHYDRSEAEARERYPNLWKDEWGTWRTER